jgi:hypothetical protein
MITLLYMSPLGAQELSFVILSAALFVGIFLALRSLFLWYWKVNTIVKNQEIQIKLLTELVQLNKGTSKSESGLSMEEKAKLFDLSKK